MTMRPCTWARAIKSALILHKKRFFLYQQLLVVNRSSFWVEPEHPAHQCLDFYWPDLLWLFFRSPELLGVYDHNSYVTKRRQHSVHFSPSSRSYIMSASSSTMFLNLGGDGVTVKVPQLSPQALFSALWPGTHLSTNWCPLQKEVAEGKLDNSPSLWE